MECESEIAQLRERVKGSRTGVDVEKFELCHREIRNELLLKRSQVVQLKKELDNSNSKVFELSRQLEANKSILKETEFSLKLALNKSKILEEKMKEINESHTTLKLKEEMRMSETQILNENIQKIAHEKQCLAREVEDLKDKLKYSRAFQDELEDRQCKINALTAKIRESTDKLENEHQFVEELNKKSQSAEEFKNACHLLSQENSKLRNEYIKLENAYIENYAKYETLNNWITRQKTTNQWNILEKIKFLQSESYCKNLQQKNSEYEQTIAKLSRTLDQEIEANSKLILQNEAYEDRIRDLEEKLHMVKIEKKERELDEDVIEIE
ncbi:paramyosin isoform X2 [Tribolium castaneum]|nr:PREDICTED: paramyosin isoform X2 [Tribolium castaneum]|eukprot:XP_015836038.1 PREDICTED: paramyosin isoform X2 [Tribolium castaneum]